MSTSKYHGLINQGSTCYLNSVLQVLFMTKEFREAVESYSCDSKALDFHLKDLFNELKSDAASTTKLTEVLGISRDFLQSDAAEWFENILNKMSNPEASQLFQGIQTTKNKCISCNRETRTEDPFWSLPLEMKNSIDDYDVFTGFENYFNESTLSGENQLYCEKCSTKSDTTMRVEMKHHPEVLTLLLKRFTLDYRFMEHVKVNRRVKIPELLQIPPYGEMTPTYQLYAYVEHSGELRNGHYIVTIKDQDGDWYMFNDRRVSKRYLQLFSWRSYEMSREAYLLFYRKISATVADNNGTEDNSTSTSGYTKSDQSCRINIDPTVGQEGEEDHFVTNSNKPTEDRKLVEIDTSNSNVEMGNKQVQSDRRRSTKDTDKQDQAKLNKSLTTGLHNEDSVDSKTDNRKGDNQAERQEQDKAAAQAEFGGIKEKGEIHIEKKNNKMDKQAKDQQRIQCDFRNEQKQYTKYDLVKTSVDVQNNPSKPHSDRKEFKMTPQNPVDVCNRAEVNSSNKEAQSNRSEDDGEGLTNLVDNKEQHDQHRTEMEFILNKPAENHKPPQKRKNSHSPEIDQHVEIWGEFYEICETMINGKNEKFILLKKICQASEESFSIKDQCYNRDCIIHKLRFAHTHVSEEQCTMATVFKRKVIKMQTGGSSESYRGGRESSQEKRPENQPGQIITAHSCPPDQNQMNHSTQSSTTNKLFENIDTGLGNNSLTSQLSRDTTCSLEVGGGAGGYLQQPLGPQCPCSSEGLTCHLQGLKLNDSSDPNKAGDQRVCTKGGTYTENQQFIDSGGRKNANYQSDTQPQVKTDETEKGSKDVCSNLFSQFFNKNN